jgi:hypothetical protein
MTKQVKTIQKFFSLAPVQVTMLEELEVDFGYISKSEVVRHAIMELYRRKKPEYLKPTTTELIKKKVLDVEESFEAMTDEEFVNGKLFGIILKSLTGESFVALHALGNSFQLLPLVGIKDFISSHREVMDFHLETNKSTDISEVISGSYSEGLLLRQYNIDVKNQDK